MNDDDKRKLAAMNAGLNRWAVQTLGIRPKQTQRLSLAAALREADKCRLRMNAFGHY